MKTILEEALEITNGARATDYGDARESFKRISELCLAMDVLVSAKEVVKVLMAVKLIRESHGHGKDHLVDLVGYTRLLSILEGDEEDV